MGMRRHGRLLSRPNHSRHATGLASWGTLCGPAPSGQRVWARGRPCTHVLRQSSHWQMSGLQRAPA